MRRSKLYKRESQNWRKVQKNGVHRIFRQDILGLNTDSRTPRGVVGGPQEYSELDSEIHMLVL